MALGLLIGVPVKPKNNAFGECALDGKEHIAEGRTVALVDDEHYSLGAYLIKSFRVITTFFASLVVIDHSHF